MPNSNVFGRAVLSNPLFNRGVAFTLEERARLGLVGRLPPGVLTLQQQADRAYAQLQRHADALSKNVDLEQLHDRNEVLYYKILVDHLTELLPIIYAPTVGNAIKEYSKEYRRPRGVYLSVDRLEDVRLSFELLRKNPDDVDIVVATDGESILGIGDWGVGGMAISSAKLSVYIAAAGIHPSRVIPVMLDVGTDNQELLNHPWYVGNRHSRNRGPDYDELIDRYVAAVTELYPHALLHWEDFGPGNARRILERYRDTTLTFNDDMQGTGAVALAAITNGLAMAGGDLCSQTIVIYGAGTAGIGIADQVRDAMVVQGLSREDATSRFWCLDKNGLLHQGMADLQSFQKPYARPAADLEGLGSGTITLQTVVEKVRPTVLIGTSTQSGAFTKRIVEAMCKNTPRPIILPMSNPTEKLEATPQDLIKWSKGTALVATGLPFKPVPYRGTDYKIAQANNALIFPGLGLGVSVCRATRITDGMFSAAARAIAAAAPDRERGASLLPDVANLRGTSANVAVAVIRQALEDGVATREIDDVAQAVHEAMWVPDYPDVREVYDSVFPNRNGT